MKTIIYTPSIAVKSEVEIITSLLDAGADYLYLRQHDRDSTYWMAYVEQIPSKFYKQMICSDFRTLHEMNLGGFHFRSEWLLNMDERDIAENLSMLRKSNKLSSVTVRNVPQMKLLEQKFDLMLAAPMFESISKPGHLAKWNFEELKEYLHTRTSAAEIFALGGIDFEKLDMLHLLGFDGIALLGALWENPSEAMTTFGNILDKCNDR